MLREHIFSSRTPTDPHFRWRGGDVSRLEGLSDAGFAFAMTMLVVDSFRSMHTYQELLFNLAHVPALMACFAILMWLWSAHYSFFRRFGLEDPYTIFLNAAMLFTVMVYVFPLKFVLNFLITDTILGVHQPGVGNPMAGIRESGSLLMQIYSLGFIIIFLLFFLMARHAYNLRDKLQLDEMEIFLTRSTIQEHAYSAGIGVFAFALVTVLPMMGMQAGFASLIAGMSYALNGPVHWLHGIRVGRGIERIEKQLGVR